MVNFFFKKKKRQGHGDGDGPRGDEEGGGVGALARRGTRPADGVLARCPGRVAVMLLQAVDDRGSSRVRVAVCICLV